VGAPAISFSQEVIGHPKIAGEKELLSIAVVLESSRFADQGVDDMPIVEVMLDVSR